MLAMKNRGRKSTSFVSLEKRVYVAERGLSAQEQSDTMESDCPIMAL